MKELDIDSGDLSFTLKRSSWENLFIVLGELGLGEMTAERDTFLREKKNIQFTEGNFWAAIQSLQAQYEEIVGASPKTHL